MSAIFIQGGNNASFRTGSVLRGPAGAPAPTEVTNNFNSYANGTLLSTQPGWFRNVPSDFMVQSGSASATAVAGINIEYYEPAGFTTAANHEAEVVLVGAAAGAGNVFHGAVVAHNPAAGATSYVICMDNTGSIFLFNYNAAGAIGGLLSVVAAANIPAGTKLKISVTGTGATRAVTGMYDIGGGWVTPAGWANKNFGAGFQYDGGKAGIMGFDSTGLVRIDSLTVRNMP